MNSNVVGPNQIIKVGPMQVDKLNQSLYPRPRGPAGLCRMRRRLRFPHRSLSAPRPAEEGEGFIMHLVWLIEQR
jgi:hypothetical protein